MKYLKKFDNLADYQAYIGGGGVDKPNVSLVVEDKSVHYIKKDPEYQKDAVFYGLCKAKTVDCYWGAGGGTNCIYYIDNYDGTYTYYCINANKAKQWWDKFVWNNGNDVISLEVNPNAQIWETNNNRFNNPYIKEYNFNNLKIATKSLRETFYNCNNIEIIDISTWNLANNTDFYASFAASVGKNVVSSLRIVKLPADCGTKVTLAHKMFGWHRGLETVEGMTTVDFSNVTNFSEMFCENYKLKNVDFKIDNWVTSKTTDIHSMFLKCYELDFSTIGDFTTWDVSNVIDANGIFANCGFVDLDLSGWDLRNCTNLYAIFQDQLYVHKTINLSNWQLDLSKLVTHNDMFTNCINLESITLKGCSDDVVNFFKTQLMTDIPNRVKSGNLSLILDSGTYSYDDSTSEWKIK